MCKAGRSGFKRGSAPPCRRWEAQRYTAPRYSPC
jgi:hypothetical protein